MTQDFDGALIALAKPIAAEHGLAPELVCAVIERESSWRPWALRYEAAFFQRYVAGMFTTGKIGISEAYSRAISWGLMQLIGQSAREQGFTGQFLSELCNPPTGIEYGCRLLAKKMALAKGDVTQALLDWNGGDDKSYPGTVLALEAKYK